MKNEEKLNGVRQALKYFLYDLDKAIQLFYKIELTITSGVRTYAEQKKLWDDRKNNPYPVGNPDNPLSHYFGDAADVSIIEFKPSWSKFKKLVAEVLAKHPDVRWGEYWPKSDPVHFYIGSSGSGFFFLLCLSALAYFTYPYFSGSAQIPENTES